MTDLFATRNGRLVPADATDPAPATALIRTVSRYTDGRPIDRPQLCVALSLCGGSQVKAQALAETLDRRGYLPPEEWPTPEEWTAIEARFQADHIRAAVRGVLLQGLPLPLAIDRAGYPPGGRRENQKRQLKRYLEEVGWHGGERPVDSGGAAKR